MIGIQRFQKLIDLWAREAARVVVVVDIGRRGADQNKGSKQAWRLVRGDDADHRAYRVADKYNTRKIKGLDDLYDIVSVAFQACILDC